MEIPIDKITPEALDQLLEDFILREGTDYGHNEPSLQNKKQQILKQINNRLAYISYDPETDSCSIVRKQ